MPKGLEQTVRRAYDHATKGTGSPDELLSAVRILVRDLKGAGQPPEKVIVAVKQVCRLPMTTVAGDTDSMADADQTKQICAMMVRAAIDEYYSNPVHEAIAETLRSV